MTIRLADEHDAQRLAQMRWDFHAEHREPISQTYEEFSDRFASFLSAGLASARWFVWVAENGGKIVSHIYVFVVPKVPRPTDTWDSWGYMTNVYTIPGYRGSGVGSTILTKVTAWARSKNLELLLVWPSEESARFYERAGFARSREAMEKLLEPE